MPRIHLIAPAGSLHSFYGHLGVQGGAEMMIPLFQQYVGASFQLTGNLAILDAHEDEFRGGRCDDAVRAADITAALADDDVSAILSVRGGAWFTRILPHIDFQALNQRRRPMMFFGFSELTPLVNIIAAHPRGIGIHDMGPAFLTYGLKRCAALQLSERSDVSPETWMQGQLHEQLGVYLRAVANTVALLRPQKVPITGQLRRGRLAGNSAATFVGGNLTVLSTMLGSRYAECVAPDGHWLVLEDFNDKPERLDRFLAHFTLAQYWQRCEGLLLGDFHRGETDLLPAILAMLDHHIGSPDFPVLTTPQIGHTWPMTPLPLHHPGRWHAGGGGIFEWLPEPFENQNGSG